MTHHGADIAAVVMALVLGWTARGAAERGQPLLMAPDARVRGVGLRFAVTIKDATARSKTFRGLVEQIGSTDGIVYVAEGECGHGVRACLITLITLAGPNRVLRILVDPQKADRELMGSIGHELQHAVEVLSHRGIRSSNAMILFYLTTANVGPHSNRFETYAAIEAGNAVRTELRDGEVAEHREAGAR